MRMNSNSAWVLYNATQESIEKDAVIDCDSLQDTESDLHYPEDRDDLWSAETVERYQAPGRSTEIDGSIENKNTQVTHNLELCQVADGRYRRLDRVLEQKSVNAGVWKGLHLQKTNMRL